MDSDYRHPKHSAMERMIREGLADKTIAAELHADRRAVSRVRRIIGVPPLDTSTTTVDKMDRFTTDLGDGHTGWTGRRNRTGGAPVIRHRGREIPAAHVAFTQRTGRSPVGMCRAECGVLHCLTLTHVLDDIERRTVRSQERALYGLDPVPWTECPSGHPWDEHGRIQPDLTPYCKGCNTDRMSRNRHSNRKGSAS